MSKKVIFLLFLLGLTVLSVLFFKRVSDDSAKPTQPAVKVEPFFLQKATQSANTTLAVAIQATPAAETSVSPNQTIDEKTLGFFAPDYQEKNKTDFTSGENSLLDALKKKYGNKAQLILNSSENEYAQGVVNKDGSDDKWWLAAKNSSGKWRIVVEGYSYANCSDIASYHFPTSMVPVCWGSNTLVTR